MKKLKLLIAACALVVGSTTASAEIVSGTTYYLQNKASGRFISSGHAWFTRSTLSPVLDYPIQLTSSGDGYILKVVGSNQLGHNLYVDNGSNNVWTVTAVAGEENVYTIANGTSYLGSDGSFVLSGSLTDATSDAAKWYIRTKDDYLAMFASASAENPVDASFYITGPSYDYTDTNRDNKWTMTNFGAGTDLGRSSSTTAINPYVVERYNGTGSIKQTLTGLKKGMYGVSVYGFYRAGNNNTATASRTAGTEAQNAIMYAGTAEKPLKSVYDEAQTSAVSGSFDTSTSFGYVPNARSTAGECFANGYYKNTIYIYIESDDTNLEIGVKKDATIAEDWAIIDNWSMTYYGSEELTETEIVLAASVKTYNEALAAAQAYQSADMFDADKTALNTAISDNTIDLSGSVTEAQLIEAAANLNAAAEAAATAVNRYTTYNTANTLINGGSDVDLTSLITNPSFENNFVGWTNNGLAAQGNDSFGKTGSIYAEKWEPNGTFGVSQTIGVLPAGLYQLTADAKARSVTSARVYAAGIDQAITIADEQNTYTVNFALDDKSEVLIGFEGTGTGTGASWLCVDNFTLKYVGALPDELTAITGNMNATVATAQTSAINAYNANNSATNYNTAQAAIAAAQASVNAYAVAATAIADAKALKEAHNFASAAATTTFAEAIAAIEDAYTDGSLADADANNAGATLGVVVTGWHANPESASAKYLNNGFSLNDFAGALYVNQWSTEGANDGSNFLVPFYENYSADTESLAVNTFTGSLTGLENGLYKVSVWVRARVTDSADLAAATGITIDVNGGDAVNVTTGTQVDDTRFLLGLFEAEGLVKDGNLQFNVKVLEGTNISWLSFKNVKYTKDRDLTDEEKAIAPTAIALYNGENEVTEPIALDATTNTVTLTPSYTPADATEGYITWTSSDETVATVSDGVVNAVSTGSAIITATSKLAPAVSATATVTVDFTETEIAAYTNDGATRYVHNYGDNLIKNGSFEYPDNFYGWTSGTGALDAPFTIVVEDGQNVLRAPDGAKDGGTNTAKAIKTAWEIESGKTYVFGYRVKCSGTAEFHVAAMTNSISEETSPLMSPNDRKAISYSGSWVDQSYTFTNTDGYKYLRFSARWLSNSVYFDDFYLVEKIADDQTIGNVDYATAAIPTANIGTGAFQYSQSAIDAANALEQGTATVEDVENAYAAVTTLNVPEETQAYNLVFNADGHNYTGNALTLIPNPSQTEGLYGLKYLAPANVNLAQAFYFVHTTGNKYKVYAVDTDGKDRYITTQAEGYGTTWYEGIRTIDDASKAIEIEIRPNGDGLYLLWNTGANKAIAHNGKTNNDMFTANTANFQFVETTKPSITINTTAAGYGTTILPFAVTDIPDGVKVYTCAAVDGTTLTLAEVDALEANKPYIIEGGWNETLSGDAQGTALTYTTGLLTGVYTATDAPVGSYVLQNNDDKVGFYQVAENAQPSVGANRCYLEVTGSSKAAYFFDSEALGINAIDALTNGEAEIYNLNGVRLPNLQKGMNIIKMKNGRTQKVMVK